MSLIYVDSNVFIVAFETELTVATPARDLFRAARDRHYSLVTSELTIAEVLAPASTPGSLALAKKLEIYRTVLIWGDLIKLIPVTRAVLLDTVQVRAECRQKLPDAIHVATALRAGCRHFCSSDRDARRLPPALTTVTPDSEGVSHLIALLKA